MDLATLKRCVDNPEGPDCEALADAKVDELLAEAQAKGEELISDATGVDPEVVRAGVECIKSGDREACAKASAKIAVTYACAAFTSGAGTLACNELAPILIDKLWPLLGPPLTYAWDVGLTLLENIRDAFVAFVNGIVELLGFGGDDGPTETEMLNSLRWYGWDWLKPMLESAESATLTADYESRIQLGLPIDMSGMLAAPTIQPTQPTFERAMPSAARKSRRDESLASLYRTLRDEPGFGDLYLIGQKLDEYAGPVDIHFQDMRYLWAREGFPARQEDMVLTAPAMPPGWRPGDTTWSPAGFKLVQYGLMPNMQNISAGYSLLLEARATAIRQGASTAVGEMVAMNTMEHRQSMLPIQAKSNLGWWLLGLTGVGAAAYYYRAPLRKMIGA